MNIMIPSFNQAGEKRATSRDTRRGVVFTIGILLVASASAQTVISGEGVIESKSGGFKFPDGTVQTTAAAEAGDPCATAGDPSDEMIPVGGVCIDKYEASVWSQPDGGIQYGVATDDYPCADDGQDCFGLIYARSVPGVQPSAFITWFQAQQALANAGKRLPSNAEWQMAVAGTPDTGGVDDGGTTCNTDDLEPGVASTGSRSGCVSAFGHHDMVGNLAEWVADWVPLSTACPGWFSSFSDDLMCLSGASTDIVGPGALVRGGDWDYAWEAGPFAVSGTVQPSEGTAESIGFRGAR
ncbi:MAG: hypothetical protein DWQ36_06365 [Acidobacteria bacterium]|nr:MAG: hypothetical protein DWQ30_19370 [Acidobacteriota bacterium]REK09669.1 MAG: hypothetical protein DWQ36_06365 [Acidobacteriota bacterium]